MTTPLCRLSGITKSFTRNRRKVPVLKGVSLTVHQGDFCALRGPSGKTTLLLIAGGLLVCDRGSVSVNGTDLSELGAEQRAHLRARSIGFVFQQFHLLPYLNVIDNIRVPALALGVRESSARARELVEQFDLTGREEHLPSELSTGERQRVALARALYNRPSLILADEPTGNLDTENAERVLHALSAFAAAGGAVLLVTHDDRAASHAHKTEFLINGVLNNAARQAATGG